MLTTVVLTICVISNQVVGFFLIKCQAQGTNSNQHCSAGAGLNLPSPAVDFLKLAAIVIDSRLELPFTSVGTFLFLKIMVV